MRSHNKIIGPPRVKPKCSIGCDSLFASFVSRRLSCGFSCGAISSSLAVVQSTSVGQTNSSSWRCLTEPATVTVESPCRRCGRGGDDGGVCDPVSELAFESEELGFVPSAVILQLSSMFSSSPLFCCRAAARKRSSRSCFVSWVSCLPDPSSSL